MTRAEEIYNADSIDWTCFIGCPIGDASSVASSRGDHWWAQWTDGSQIACIDGELHLDMSYDTYKSKTEE